jgi:membrane-associated phospholipid phosphatase
MFSRMWSTREIAGMAQVTAGVGDDEFEEELRLIGAASLARGVWRGGCLVPIWCKRAAAWRRIVRAHGKEDQISESDPRRWAVQAVEQLAAAQTIRGRRVRLPLIDRRLRIPAVVGGGLLLIALFVVPERFHLGEPTSPDRSVVDDWIPFLAWTIWVYVSYYLFLILAVWLPKDDKRRSDAAYGLVLAAIIGAVIFTLWPTSVMRQSPSFDGATGFLWHLLFSVDTTFNALPSLHVANTCLAAIALWSRRGLWRIIVPVWAPMIILSTLTTKQHYAIDVLGGLLLAAICFVLVRFGVEYGPPSLAARFR